MTAPRITGLGLVSSIGNSCEAALDSLRAAHTGIGIHPQLAAANAPAQLAGLLHGFGFPTEAPHTWTWPDHVAIPRTVLRSLAPHGVYAHVALHEALAQAHLTPADLRDPGVGLLTASAGSNRLLHAHTTRMLESGIGRCHPLIIPSSIAGTLTFNLAASLGITGPTGGTVAACASSALALGLAADQIRLGRAHTMIVVGAEDADLHSILPFASIRALTTSRDPSGRPSPFDRDRDGFAGTGGAAVLILESADQATARGIQPLAELAGWGWASDGHHPMAPEPEGRGLERAIHAALRDADLTPADVDHVNAHAPSTPSGDLAEARALTRIFGDTSPRVTSTKGQTGHALSMAGALEAVLSILCIQNDFVPANLNLRHPDPAAATLDLPTEPREAKIHTVLSNSSGFGGTNTGLILRRAS